MNVNTSSGVSLVEMLATLAVVTALSFSVSPLASLLVKQQLINTQSELRLLVSRARHDALSYRERITICSLADDGNCQSQWADNITVFFDPNGNRRIDPGEQAINRIDVDARLLLSWRGMKPTNSIHFNAMGHTFVSNGTFTLCHPTVQQSLSLIISRQGRTRSAKIEQPCTKSPTT
ncbi:GspH/FimT family pseudopilin [Pseudomonas sp. MBLB4123]|uniref:GspH/FimT family pseudopilin n=1 Tax=Pseudomonas sp. MBLB4123 TaxID=3451557 RepID=UPI003F74B287